MFVIKSDSKLVVVAVAVRRRFPVGVLYLIKAQTGSKQRLGCSMILPRSCDWHIGWIWLTHIKIMLKCFEK